MVRIPDMWNSDHFVYCKYFITELQNVEFAKAEKHDIA